MNRSCKTFNRLTGNDVTQNKRRNNMKTHTLLKKLSLWTIAAVVALVVAKAPAHAATSAAIDIHVSINATKALTVGASFYNFGALGVNTSSVSATAILVTNTSGAIAETYT